VRREQYEKTLDETGAIIYRLRQGASHDRKKRMNRAIIHAFTGSALSLVLALPLLTWCAAQTRSSAENTAESQKLVITVNDENGVPVAGARVQLKGPQLTLHCETDFAGHCEFSGLSPGTCELAVEKTGFYTSSLPNVQVGATHDVDLTLSHQQAVREVVDVVESTPAIDPAQIASKEELTGAELIDIPYPGPHDYRNALTFIPGTTPDAFGQFHVAGAETYQTLTLLDGFNVTQPATGQLQVRSNVDSFRSIAVQPSREPAEDGKGSGGVLALNTGMGDDHFRFISTDFVPSVQNTKGLALSEWTPIITASGPIIEGKMWFIDSLDGDYDNTIIKQLPSGNDRDQAWRVDNLAKLQANLTPRNILKVSFLSNYLHDPHAGISFLDPPQTTPNDAESAYIGSVKDQYSFRGGALLETGFGVDQYTVALTPAGTAPYIIGSEGNAGNYFENQRTLARRVQGLSNLYLAPKNWHGRHDIKLGADLDRLTYSSQFLRQPISFLRANQTLPANETCLTAPEATPPQPSPCARYSVFSGGDYSSTYNFEASAYAEDRWLVSNHLLIEPGVRLDWDEIVRTPLLSPRLAGTYIFDDESNTKLSAGVGIVYDVTHLGLIAQPFAGQRVDYFFDANGNPVDVNGNPAPQAVPLPSVFSANRNTLSEPRYLNWSVALEKKLPALVFLKAEFIEKRGVHGFAYNTLNGAVDGNFVLGNTRSDRYDAVSVSMRHNFRQRYAIYGAYTRSRVRSNEVFDFSLDIPLLSPQRPGPYPWDVPNRFVGWGILPVSRFPLVHAFDVVYSAEARSGLPFNVVNDQQAILPSAPPGTFRLPTYYSVNLALEKRVHLFGFFWAVRGGLLNVTNHANVGVANGTIDRQHPSPTYIDDPGRGLDVRIRLLGRK